MPLSTVELANARELVKQILDDLRLDAYLFEVEPGEGELEIKIECAVKEGWETVTIKLEKELLLSGVGDPDARLKLLEQWRDVLSSCLPEA